MSAISERERLMTGVGDRPADDRRALEHLALGHRQPGAGVAVGLAEARPVPPFAERGKRDLASRRAASERRLAHAVVGQLEAAKAGEHVREPAAEDVVLAHRVAELAVVDDVDARVALAGDDVGDGPRQCALVVVVNWAVEPVAPRVAFDQALRARQAPTWLVRILVICRWAPARSVVAL